MSLIEDMERLDLFERVNSYGFCKEAEIFWLHKFRNLPEHQYKSRRQIEQFNRLGRGLVTFIVI
jgi:hypothetical protein